MNLIEFLKKSPHLCEIVPAAVLPDSSKRRIGDRLYRGYALRGEQAIRLTRPLSRQPLVDLPSTLGWHLWSDAAPAGASVVVTLHHGDVEVAREARPLPAGVLTPVPLPRALYTSCLPSELDLRCSVQGCDGLEMFLAVHEVLSRQPLYDLCVGYGVEIGPGPRPQILFDALRDVVYVEQKGYDEWFKLYNIPGAQRDEDTWSRYRVGEAHRLPVPAQSCDFIFSSHVLEHLANPIGHIEVWLSHLRSGGHIVGVVPDMAATNDHMMEPSTIEELMLEYRSGVFMPDARHYRRAIRKYGASYDHDRAMADKFSIHVHYYLPRTLSRLLDEASRFLPIAGWGIQATPNHKDFHFVVRKR
ncbi:MAG TPA: methyltransferase domain-containing protein [Albitalea sp.]|nr:methyltransferase domain-containing protein [Albitalea sp.]